MPRSDDYPAFLFYPDDFSGDGDVEAMTTEEVGAYILLICKAWREKPTATIPNDERVLARWARMTPERFTEAKASILRPWKLSKCGTRYTQPRLKKEFDKLQTRRRSSSKAASIAATERWKKNGIMRDACEPHDSRIKNAMPPDERAPIRDEDETGIGISSEGGLGETEIREAARRAFDQWSVVSRGGPIREVNNEHRKINELLSSLAQGPPVIRGRDSIPAYQFVSQAAEMLKVEGAEFRTVHYACKSVQNRVEKWIREGVPVSGNAPKRSKSDEVDEMVARVAANMKD